MDKDVVYIYNGILLSHKKRNEVMSLVATWMDLQIIMLSEMSQRGKDKYVTYMWNLWYDTNKPIYQAEIASWTSKTNLSLSKGKRGEEIN